MPKPTSKSRQELRSRFVSNAIPTERDFADLIAASLNQAEDGLFKLSDESLALVRKQENQPVLRFFADPDAKDEVWQVQLGTGETPSFGLTAANGKLALVVDGATGNVGIGTATPISPLTITGCLPAGEDRPSRLGSKGAAAIIGICPQLDFIDIDHKDWSIYVDAGRLHFIREPWEYRDLVLDGKGNVGIGTDAPAAKLQITGNASITALEGKNYACMNNYMAPGSLAIGGIDRNYGGGSSKWNSNTAALLLETLDNTEIAIHDASTRLASFMYYEGANNCFTIGRDMGWGAISTVRVEGSMKVSGCLTPSSGTSESSGLLFPKNPGGGSGDAAWLRYYASSGEACVLEIGIANDPDDFIYLKSSGGVKIDVLKLGDKWRLSGVGDRDANDEWLRMMNTANTAYYGGFAAAKFWTFKDQYTQSDLHSKSNIKNLSYSLESILNLQGVSFTWNDDLVKFVDKDSESLGLIAQDVEKVFPQLVQSGPDGKLGVNYIGLIPVLVECIKEQQAQIHRLRDELVNHL